MNIGNLFATLLLASTAVLAPGVCAADELDRLADGMIRLINEIQDNRSGGGEITRFNQGKSLGCFAAEFEVAEDLAAELGHGLFAKPGRYPALVRFASASSFDDRDKDLRGMSIRVSGIDGESLAGPAGEQVFLLNSYPALFVDTPETFHKFILATYRDERIRFFINPFDSHLKSLWILLQARENHTSPFDIRFFSTTPFALGESGVVKYAASPCSSVVSELPDELSKNYLRAAMRDHLAQAPVCFDFMVQQQTNDSDMPIEDASVIWDEDSSPFRKVARIHIQGQDFDSDAALAACEQTSFSPWHSLPQHRPLGRMNQVRKRVYEETSKFRLEENRRRRSN